MSQLEHIQKPEDLRLLTPGQLDELAQEIREFLVNKVAATGGHLGPNLGMVEVTLAVHSVFESPKDPILFDTGHQAYVHKILTGRKDNFDSLRQKDGLSGYPDRAESIHDWTESSHASASLSYADGLAKAFKLKGEDDRTVVAIVGDGALTGGMCWEALNNIGANKESNVVVILNDNGRSYSPTIGGVADSLAKLRVQPQYDKVMESGKNTLGRMGKPGNTAFRLFRAMKEGIKRTVIPSEIFSELGFKYVGPVDGHNPQEMIEVLEYAKNYDGPVLIHTVTEKGHGYAPAVNNTADQMHATGKIDPKTGQPTSPVKLGWTSVFSDELINLAEEDESIVAITAAMAEPTGLKAFAEKYPERLFDVGIAEQQATTSAAGLALGGMRPIVAMYSTFFNRAFDQMLMDVALLKLPVTFVLDRAGVTGPDGPSHNGMWDLSLTGIIPGIHVAAPRDGQELRRALRRSTKITSGPIVIRFPKGTIPENVPALEEQSDYDVLYRSKNMENTSDFEQFTIAIVNYGSLAGRVIHAVSALHGEAFPPSKDAEVVTIEDKDMLHNAQITVVDPHWVTPVTQELLESLSQADLIITVEDGGIHGGAGQNLTRELNAHSIDTPVRHIALPQEFIAHAERVEVLEDLGMDAQGIAQSISHWADELQK